MAITLVKGPEELLRQRAFTRVRGEILQRHPDLETIEIDAETYIEGQLAQAVSPTLFGGAKLVVLDRVEAMNAAFQKDLAAYIARPEADVEMLIRYGQGQRGKKLLSDIAKVATVIDCPKIERVNDKIRLIQDDARAAKRKITRGAIQALIDSVGDDTMELAAAAAQLFADIPGLIDEDAVARLHSQRVKADRYLVADLAVGGNLSEALVQARHALVTGTPPQVLISALEIKLRQVALISGGKVPKGMPPWSVDKTRRVAHRWNDRQLAVAVEAIAAANEETKGASLDPQFAVERAIRIVATLAAKDRY